MRTALLLSLLCAVTAPSAALAQAAEPPVRVSSSAFLNISPKRLTFDSTRRNGAIYVLNQGSEPVTVDIGFVDRVMAPDGQIYSADEAAGHPDGPQIAARLKSAKDLLQVSPRRVTLQPGRPQTVRVRLSVLPNASDGEHRSHLTVTTLPPRDAGPTAETAAAGGRNELRFDITAVYGLSIPIIVRPGDTDARAAIENLHIEPAATAAGAPARPTPVLALDLVRAGSSSIYGNFEVRIQGAPKGAEPLGLVRGVAVYPEIERRLVRIPLSRAPAPGERLEVTFTDDDTSPGRVLAKAGL
jgi:P pilus assembly chaperone PapD